ncbi:sulfotransferase family protein [Halovulum sp. GXIMD14794]
MTGHRYVFVGGLHRSGTSLVARLIGSLPGVASITGAPVPENEGAYLQGAIPHTARHGAPMSFATDPTQHLVEGCAYDRFETRQRIEADWAKWFDPAARWRVEKSPVNLTRMRLYQQLFPLAQFVVVLRHPQAVAAAVAKWLNTPTPALIDHWIQAHARVAVDLTYLHAALVLRYEDVVADPHRARDTVAKYLGVECPDLAPEPVRDGNREYDLSARLDPAQNAELARWGYAGGGAILPAPLDVRHPLRSVRESTAATWVNAISSAENLK